MANLLTQKKFDFVSHFPGLAQDAFTVVAFSGIEGFSTCYRFEITLVADDPEIDMTAVLEHPATFTILREEGDIPFHGILTEFEQLHAIDEYVVYKTVLSPKLWWLSLTHHNQIFLNRTVPQVLEAVLVDGGLTTDDFDLRLMNPGRYEPWEFICQYGESHLNFVSRWMEREGMYYYFEQTPAGEKVVITDTGMSHGEMPEGKTMSYSPPSGLDEPFREEVIHAFICRQKLLPGKLHVQDYNYRTPSLSLSAESPVSDRGRGEFHIYGEHFRTMEEGTAMAKLRAEELRSHEKRFHGESTVPFLRPGYLFDLERHYRSGFNQQYLTIELEHAGSQSGFLISGIQKTLSETEQRNYYRNSFVAIPSEVQYRHPKKSEKPRFFGTINATIDAEGSGEYAELDDQGRYKVRFPFDLSGRDGGKASHWVRMAQPYAGTDHGMHFPLHKGTEVLLTFIEGDPDRPIVASAVPNPEKPSVIQDETQTKAAITTSGQNKIHFEDQAGNQRILMHSPTANSWVRIGSPNDPPNPYTVEEGDEIAVFTDSDGDWDLYENGSPVPSKVVSTSDDGTSVTYRLTKEFTVNVDFEGQYKVDQADSIFDTILDSVAEGSTHSLEGETWTLTETLDMEVGDSESVEFYREKTVTLSVEGDVDVLAKDPGNLDGIRIQSSDNVWIEGENRYANYMIGGPDDSDTTVPREIRYLWEKFYGSEPGFNPSGMKLYDYGDGVSNPVHEGDLASMSLLARRGQVKLAKGDTFNTQEGNIYDFGGYWEYNLGNSYAENFMHQDDSDPDISVILNEDGLDHDKAAKGGPLPGTISCEGEKMEGPLDDNTWIEKTIGGAGYEYTKDKKSLEVSVGCTEETHTYGQTSYEYKYAGTGNKTAYSKSGGGITEDKRWCRDSGNLLSYSISRQFANGKNTMQFDWANTTLASFNFSASASFSFTAAASISLALSVAFSLSMEFAPPGSIKIENSKITVNLPGLEWTNQPPFDAKTAVTKLKQSMAEIESSVSSIENTQVEIESGLSYIAQSTTTIENMLVKLIG
jgi:type VI secretion system VgrG family protein